MGKLKELLNQRTIKIKESEFPKMNLKRTEPIKWELLYTRLASIVQTAKETAKRVSASPVVRESGECIFAAFTPEGDSIAMSDGLLIHVASIGSAIKWMIQNDYEENEEFHPGDLFFNNDAHIGGAHPPDQLVVTPVFHNGEIVSWTGGLTHITETGATEAGGSSPNAMSRFDEGICWPCIRVGENWELNHNLERIVERGTRNPHWWLLDQRARVAGIRIMHDGILELIEEFGLKFYQEAIYEYIEDTRSATIKTLKTTLFPGRYKAMVPFDANYRNQPVRYQIDHLLMIMVEMTISADGEFGLDLGGTSPPGRHPFNSSLPCLVGNVISWALQQLLYDVKYNQGIAQALTSESALKVPPGIVVNPADITYATSLFSTAFSAFAAMSLCESRAHYPMGFREMILAGHAPAGPGTRVGGIDQYGRILGGTIGETVGRGIPALGIGDGVDAAYVLFNPATDYADAEQWERMFPLVYLGRGIRKGSGYGKYRGGHGLESLYMVCNTDDASLSSAGGGHKVYNALGIMGGYPGSCNYKYLLRNSNIKETIEARRPLPHSEGNDPSHPEWLRLLKGESLLVPLPTPAMSFKSYDLWYHEVTTSGGYGDPIERDPELVRKDIELDIGTIWEAEKVYHVRIDPKSLKVDYEETKKMREERRKERLARAVPTEQYISQIREQILTGNIPEPSKTSLNNSLRISPKFRSEFIQCWGLPEELKQIP
jgi:acetone carboxylase alpha subunit